MCLRSFVSPISVLPRPYFFSYHFQTLPKTIYGDLSPITTKIHLWKLCCTFCQDVKDTNNQTPPLSDAHEFWFPITPILKVKAYFYMAKANSRLILTYFPIHQVNQVILWGRKKLQKRMNHCRHPGPFLYIIL